MNIFNRNTTKKHIKQFEIKIAGLLSDEFPQFKKVIGLSEIHGIHFMEKPQRITLTGTYSQKSYEEINRNHNTSFKLNGISVLERKTKKHIPIKLTYFQDSLSTIEVSNPKQFHRTYDLNNIKVGTIEIEPIKIQNPDKETVLKILKKDLEKLNLLDIENTFEIEIGEKLYYTILDGEDGNYIAVDKQGKVYRLNHDHKERVKIISQNVSEFLEIYNGQKEELEKIIYEEKRNG